MPAQISFPIVERQYAQVPADFRQEVGLTYVHGGNVWEAEPVEIPIPRKRRSERLKLDKIHPMIGLVRVAPLDAGHGRLGQTGLNRHHRIGFRGRFA